MFRRRSSTEFTGNAFNQIVDEKQMSTLLDEMGAHVNKDELKKGMEKVDPNSKFLELRKKSAQ
jgi:hypothetical protein